VLPNVEIRYLHAVIALAEELNFTRAADRLRITESQAVKFIWETFNLTNTPRFDVGSLQAAGNNGGGNLLFTNSVSFGQFTSTLTKPRVMQFALRYSF
jgi:hypothetical protein